MKKQRRSFFEKRTFVFKETPPSPCAFSYAFGLPPTPPRPFRAYVLFEWPLIQYSGNYSKTTSLWQYYKGELNDNLTDSESFKSKIKITGKTPADGNTKDIEIILPLK